MKFWLGVTDSRWYQYLRERKPEDSNFWQPSGHQQEFKVIEKGAPFLFKLKAHLTPLSVSAFIQRKLFYLFPWHGMLLGRETDVIRFLNLSRRSLSRERK